MNQTALKFGAPALASVNLVPKEIAERKVMGAVRLAAIVALMVAVGVVALGYLLMLGIKATAQSELDDAVTQQNSILEARDKKVPVYYEYVLREQQELALAQAGWGEIEYSNLAIAFANVATGQATSFDILSFVGPSAIGVPGPSGDLLFGNGVGLVSFEARASSPSEASGLIARIEAVPGVASVRANSEQFTDQEGLVYWKVSGAAVITANALTNRFFSENTLTGIDILSLVAIPSAETAGVDPSVAPESAPPSPQPSAEGEG